MIHELEERQEQLVQARKISAIGTFTSGIAHELGTPYGRTYQREKQLGHELARRAGVSIGARRRRRARPADDEAVAGGS